MTAFKSGALVIGAWITAIWTSSKKGGTTNAYR